MGCSVTFLLVRRLLDLFRLGPSPDQKDVEIAVLRHQLPVLRRQVARPRYCPADRAVLATLARLLSRERWGTFLVTQQRCCAGTGTWSPGPGRPPAVTAVHPMPSTVRLSPLSCVWPGRTGLGLPPDCGRVPQARCDRLGHHSPKRAAPSPAHASAAAIWAVMVRVLACPGRRHSVLRLLPRRHGHAPPCLRAVFHRRATPQGVDRK